MDRLHRPTSSVHCNTQASNKQTNKNLSTSKIQKPFKIPTLYVFSQCTPIEYEIRYLSNVRIHKNEWNNQQDNKVGRKRRQIVTVQGEWMKKAQNKKTSWWKRVSASISVPLLPMCVCVRDRVRTCYSHFGNKIAKFCVELLTSRQTEAQIIQL